MGAMRRRLIWIVAVSGISASAVVPNISGAPATADPGRCGVTVTSGQDAGKNPAAPNFYYLMRNDCSVGADFRVYQHNLGRDAIASIGSGTCQWVGAHDTAVFWDPVGDTDWEPLAC